MQQISKHVFVETDRRGCDHGFVQTTDGVVMIDSPQKPSDALRWRAEIEPYGPVRYIINTEPHGDHWAGNAFFEAPVIAHEGVRSRILDTNMPEYVARVGQMGPEEPKLLENYVANAPALTFRESMSLHVGNHTIRMINMPGHTPFQSAVLIEEEGVVFTSDNVFCRVQSWLQEANPAKWLIALDALAALPAETLVPGHGPICDKTYLREQAAFVEEWVDYVRGGIASGMTKEDAVERLTDLTERYPMDAEQDGMAPRVMRLNVANIYDYILGAGIHAPGVTQFA